MEPATLEQRLSALVASRSHAVLPLWVQALAPPESLRVLDCVNEPWVPLLRAEAYLRNDMLAQAQRELEAAATDLPAGVGKMKAALEKEIARHSSGQERGGNNDDTAPGEAPLQQWLTRVREFRTRG